MVTINCIHLSSPIIEAFTIFIRIKCIMILNVMILSSGEARHFVIVLERGRVPGFCCTKSKRHFPLNVPSTLVNFVLKCQRQIL